uniref:Uncharacterized protein n=1 Tax=Arundo donax TaxID=35708 RepID=A0A0A9B1E0_ARUDO
MFGLCKNDPLSKSSCFLAGCSPCEMLTKAKNDSSCYNKACDPALHQITST